LRLIPLDLETIGDSVDRTNNLVVIQESPEGGSWGETVIARIVADHFESLDAAPALLAGDTTPIPFSHTLEQAWMPTVDRIAATIRETLGTTAIAAE
jgi:acetoin:2,6-dichlorophenolindophenol oxidoreductase subunit beta